MKVRQAEEIGPDEAPRVVTLRRRVRSPPVTHQPLGIWSLSGVVSALRQSPAPAQTHANHHLHTGPPPAPKK